MRGPLMNMFPNLCSDNTGGRELVMLQVMLSSCVKSNMWDMVQVDNCALSEAEPAIVKIPIICYLLILYRLVAGLNILMTHNVVTLKM